MAKTGKLRIAAATWTNITTFMATLGSPAEFVIIPSGTDFQLGRKATAPTAGVAMVKDQGHTVLQETGDTLVPWVFSTAGGEITVLPQITGKLSLDGTGTT